jgi:hypothetical protein
MQRPSISSRTGNQPRVLLRLVIKLRGPCTSPGSQPGGRPARSGARPKHRPRVPKDPSPSHGRRLSRHITSIMIRSCEPAAGALRQPAPAQGHRVA